MTRNHKMRGFGILIVGIAFAAGAAEPPRPPVFTASQLRADLAEIDRALREMPPDLAHSADLPSLAQALVAIDEELSGSPPLTRDQAWRIFARLNPLLADGHLFVGFVDWRGDTRTHLAEGGRLFPFEVNVGVDCSLRIRSALGGDVSPQEDSRLLSINGDSAAGVCEQLMGRTHGDSRAFRADLLSRRFWFFYWKIFGAPATFNLSTDRDPALAAAASNALPELLATEERFDRQFKVELLPNASAVLTMKSFALPDKQPLLDFTRDAFARMRAAGTRTLVIDLRDNGGGDDVMWIEGLMPYLAKSRFRTGSTYRKRVVTPDPSKGEVAGSVVDGEIETWFPPGPDEARRFRGKTYVLVGPGTYSSAVLFANVMRDFDFGRLIGTGDSVRQDQSGGTRRTTLTHTGLIVVAPRFVLRRPSGRKSPVFLTPVTFIDPGLSATEVAPRLNRK